MVYFAILKLIHFIFIKSVPYLIERSPELYGALKLLHLPIHTKAENIVKCDEKKKELSVGENVKIKKNGQNCVCEGTNRRAFMHTGILFYTTTKGVNEELMEKLLNTKEQECFKHVCDENSWKIEEGGNFSTKKIKTI